MDDSEAEKLRNTYFDTVLLQATLGRGKADRVMDEIIAERLAKEAEEQRDA